MTDWMRRARRRHLLTLLPRYGVIVFVWLAGVFRGGGVLFSLGAAGLLALAVAVYGAALLYTRRGMDAGRRPLRATSLLVSETTSGDLGQDSAELRTPVHGVIELRGPDLVWFPLTRGHERFQTPVADIVRLDYVPEPGVLHLTAPGFLTVVLRDGSELRLMTRHFGHIEDRLRACLQQDQRRQS